VYQLLSFVEKKESYLQIFYFSYKNMLINIQAKDVVNRWPWHGTQTRKKSKAMSFTFTRHMCPFMGPSSNKKKLGLVLKTRYSLSGRDLQRELT
jgi:hypothetical protein